MNQHDVRVELLTARVLRSVDDKRLDAVRATYDDGTRSGPSPTKYVDAARWIHVCARRAVALDLDLCSGLHVLDIGTGAGYLPLVCRELGHHVTATDCADRADVLRALAEVVDVDVLDADVRPFTAMQPRATYDLIASYMVEFNGHRHRPWGRAEWQFFITDALSMLASGGRLVLELNAEPNGRCYSDDVRELFVSHGAEITGPWRHRPVDGGHRIVIRKP